MTDKEKFQKIFDKLHASPDVLTEVLNMTTEKKVVPIRRKRYMPKIAVAVAALVLVVGTGSVAYAMDLGGIQRIIQVWIHGEQTNAIFTIENGTYTLDYTNENGEEVHRGGGGVAFNEDGSERYLTEEELWSEINAPDVQYEEDGRVMVYYLNQQMDITDKFEDGICYLQLQVDGETRYMTVKYQNGYAMSPHGYVQPNEFNNSNENGDEVE